MGDARQAHSLTRLFALFLLLFAGCGSDEGRPTNVLLLTVDTLRADHVSAYGYERGTTPNLDRLAAEGVRFDNAIVQRGGTWPSLTSIMTSRHPRYHGVRANGDMLDASVETLAEYMKPHGYTTLAALTNMISAPNRGFDQKELVGRMSDGERDAQATRTALDWLGEYRGKPFFLWLHLLGPHDPYAPDPRFGRFDAGYDGPLDGSHGTLRSIHSERRELAAEERAHIVSLYDGDIAQTDALVGQVLSRLDALGLRDDTLVIATADHGEELYDHNHYWLHSWSIYDSVLRVPLIVRLPGSLPAGRVVDTVVQSIDIAPTVLDLPIPESYQGRSLRDLATGSAGDSGGEAIAELGPFIHAVRTDDWHYIYNPLGYTSPAVRPTDPGTAGHFRIEADELYDVRADPGQQHNLAAERPEVTEELRGRLKQWIHEESPAPGYQPQELSPSVSRELRALGYLD